MKENKVYVVKFDQHGYAYIDIIKYNNYNERYEKIKDYGLHAIYEDYNLALEKVYQLNRME